MVLFAVPLAPLLRAHMNALEGKYFSDKLLYGDDMKIISQERMHLHFVLTSVV